MNKMCISYDMFSSQSPMTIVSNGQILDSGRVNLFDDISIIEGYCSTYNIEEIILHGQKQMLEKIKSNFNTKFAYNNISIKIVE
jgi:hypothetical protein